MATINQLPSGAFRARVRRQGAPTLSRSFTNREDAEHWAAQTERAIATGTLAEHRHRDTTLRQLLNLYKVRVTRRKNGARLEQRRIDALARDRLAAFSLSNLYRAALREFRDRRAKQVSGSTVNRDLALLSVVLKWGRAELDAPVDPTMLAGLKLPENAARERRLLPGELERLLVASPGWLRAWVTLAVESGMRRGEIAGLFSARPKFRQKTHLIGNLGPSTAPDLPARRLGPRALLCVHGVSRERHKTCGFLLRELIRAGLIRVRGRVARPFGFALTDPSMRLSRTRLFPKVARGTGAGPPTSE